MNPQRWQRLKGIFQDALALDPSQRPGYLDRACGDDDALRREVEALLANHRRADGFLADSALSQARGLAAEEDHSLAGRSLGAYRIVRPIGHGGMGSVYLAERCDAEYRQRVAVKLLKVGMASEFLVDRFRQERQILANLDHPGIARLLDGGTLKDDGRPYLVMEYIEGEPIDRYCDRHELSIRRRLELVRKVCDAVQFAHRNLVIHRDLKPSNILVTAGGTPKLLDFGTAKLLAPSEAAMPAATATGLRLLTPEYASPEQLKGESITTATDVYALGVVLYELLTGQRPYRFRSPLAPEVVRVICEQQPPRPSTVAAAPPADAMSESLRRARWRRRLAGDLDNIVLMALRKEPARRYASVEQLAEDLRRHLESRPVLARPDTVAYRAGKFLRRHRAGVAAATLVFLALTGGILATTWQTRRAVAAGARAERHLAEAKAVSEFLVDLFQVSDPGEALGNEVTAREILDRGAERIADELRDEPELQARLMDTMGVVYHRLGLEAQAADLLAEALAIRRRLDARDPEVPAILSHLGEVRQAQGEYAGAEALLEEALALRRELLGPQHPLIAQSLDDLGIYRYDRGEYAKAQALHEQALEMRRALPQAAELEIAESLNNLAAVLLARGAAAEAEKRLREALEIRRRHLGKIHPDVAVSLNNLAAVVRARGELGDAGELFAQALAMERRLHRGKDHRHVATALDNLAAVHSDLGRVTEAETLYADALEMRRRLLGPDHPDVAFSLNNLAVLHQNRGEAEQAETLYRQALALWRETLGPQHADTRLCLHDLAWMLYWTGDYRAAIPEFRHLVALQREVLGPEELEVATALLGLGLALLEGGEPRAALPHLREAQRIRRRKLPAGDVKIASVEGSVAECLIALGRYAEAEPLVLRSHAALAERLGADAELTRRARARVVAFYDSWGQPEKAAAELLTESARSDGREP